MFTLRAVRFWGGIFLVALLSACQTGSNFEKLKASLQSAAPASTVATAKAYLVRPFTFVNTDDRSDMYRKGFIVPGYKGIDYDSYGRMDAADRKAGMKSIYTMTDVHRRVADELTKLNIPTITDLPQAPEGAGTLDVQVLDTQASMRMQTYGCWPLVGLAIYLFNGNIYTVITKTRVHVTVGDIQKPLDETLEIYSESTFKFWNTYMGFDIDETFEKSQLDHIQKIAAVLAERLKVRDQPSSAP